MSFFAPLELGSFDIIHVDYPWPWETWSPAGAKKSPSAHYETMSFEDISSTRPQNLLTKNGVAVFWMTWPLIARQSMIIENCFGLTIKTGGAWSKRTRSGKLRWGPGHIVRTVCEPFVVACRKGHKLRGRSEKNLIETMSDIELPGLARQHSRKPEELFQMLERLTPGWRRADLFARSSRDGWETFGNQRSEFDRVGNGIRRQAT